MDRILEHLAEYAAGIRYGALPPAAVHAAKRVVIDDLGCALAAEDSAPARIARSLADAAGALRGAGVLGTRAQTTADLAAFCNGTLIRYLDLNDTFTGTGGAGHPSDYLAAALAAAEHAKAGGRGVILGLVVAYEVFCGMTEAAALGHRHWDHTVHGVTASAAAASAAMGLTPERAGNAISLAAVANLTLEETRLGVVSMWKGCAAANASRNGVFAALLAAGGMTGPGEAFEGRGGFSAALGCTLRPPRFGGQDGLPYAILTTHFKRYPAGFFSQTAIDAAIALRAQIGDPAAVRGLRIGTFPYGRHVMAGDREKWRPSTRESADHSLPYVVAVALLEGDLTASGLERHLGDPAVHALLDRITVEVDPACEQAWPAAAMTRLAATLDDGTERTAEVRHHRGHTANPFSDAELEEKFRNLLAGRRPPDTIDRILDRLWHLEEVTDLGGLIALTAR